MTNTAGSDFESVWQTVEAILDQRNHEQLCACPTFPEKCSTYGNVMPWSYSAEEAVEIVLSEFHVGSRRV